MKNTLVLFALLFSVAVSASEFGVSTCICSEHSPKWNSVYLTEQNGATLLSIAYSKYSQDGLLRNSRLEEYLDSSVDCDISILVVKNKNADAMLYFGAGIDMQSWVDLRDWSNCSWRPPDFVHPAELYAVAKGRLKLLSFLAVEINFSTKKGLYFSSGISF